MTWCVMRGTSAPFAAGHVLIATTAIGIAGARFAGLIFFREMHLMSLNVAITSSQKIMETTECIVNCVCCVASLAFCAFLFHLAYKGE